jgi:capsid portal protein
MKAKEQDGVAAHEVIHFRVEDPAYDYGVPRWVGALLNLLSSRKADQVNHDFFDNKAIPPMVASVSGGRFTNASADALRDLLKGGKGLDKFWDVLVLEAVAEPGTAMEAGGKTEIKLEPLMKHQPSDGMFLNLDERNADKVGGTFRHGRLMRGDTREINKATADASLRFTEGQVYKPERDEDDEFLNDFVLPELGISAWRFQSKGPSTTSALERGQLTIEAFKNKAISRNEAREAIESAIGVRLPRASENGYEDE